MLDLAAQAGPRNGDTGPGASPGRRLQKLYCFKEYDLRARGGMSLSPAQNQAL
jgi:hypothetical protein